MNELVLRSDLRTIKELTQEIQSRLSIDIYEAADVFLSAWRKNAKSIALWEIRTRGLPHLVDEQVRNDFVNQWFESRWWDQDHQDRQSELRTLSGVAVDPYEIKIEDLAISKKDCRRYVLSDISDVANALCKAMPRDRLVSITKLLLSIAHHSGGKVSSNELSFAFSDLYDADKTMMFLDCNEWLCEPINKSAFAGSNERADLSCDFGNSPGRPDHSVYLISKEDAESFAQQLWSKLFNEKLEHPFESLGLGDPMPEADVKAPIEIEIIKAAADLEIDPSDLPPELDAANLAFRAVTNGYGDPSATQRNRLVDYLEKHYPDFKRDQVQRIATVANPDKTTGRKTGGKE
jgi:hypothetical protein